MSEYLRRGFATLSLRPNAYVWRLLGEREVLAPINSSHDGYPTDPERNFGPSGLSIASDRWDVRQAVVIEGLARFRDQFKTLTVYVDYQTQQPLYHRAPGRAAAGSSTSASWSTASAATSSAIRSSATVSRRTSSIPSPRSST